MKIKILLLVALLLSFSGIAVAQVVKITPKKTIYKRNAKKVPDYKRTMTITRPKVSGLSAALSKKVENAVSYESVFNFFNLKKELNETFWLDEANFETEYNRRGALAMALTIDGSAAYQSFYARRVVVDLKTGKRVKAADVFIAPKTERLIKLLDDALQKKMRQATAEAAKESASDAADLTELLADKKFSAEYLEFFSINDKGVKFYYDYGFPHLALALEPNNEFFLSYAELKPFIKPDGLLARFVR